MRYTFQNDTSEPTIVIVEPWAEEFPVPSGSVLSIAITASELGTLETAMSDKRFTVWLWSGCRAVVSLDGKEQTPSSLSIPSPP
jgi:hypothetical protein